MPRTAGLYNGGFGRQYRVSFCLEPERWWGLQAIYFVDAPLCREAASRKGRLRIARRFNAPKDRHPLVPRPVGTAEMPVVWGEALFKRAYGTPIVPTRPTRH